MGQTTLLTPAVAESLYRGLPSYAPNTLLNRYDPARNVYNWKTSNTRRLRAGLGKAQAATGLAEWLIIGDSTSHCYCGSEGFQHFLMWPRIMRGLLVSNAGATLGGSGNVPAGAAGAIDPRWSFSGVWANNNGYSSSTAASAAATFSTATLGGETGTSVVLAFFGTSGPLTLTVDGATPANGSVTVSGGGTYAGGTLTPAGGLTVQTATITGLADTTHTVVLTRVSGTSYVVSAEVRRASGLIVHNIAQYGSQASGSAQWADSSAGATTPAIVRRGSVTSTPDVVFISLGVNDINSGGASAATVMAALTTIRGFYPNADVILVGEYQPSGTTLATWQGFIAALYALADTLDCPLFDMLDRSGGYTIANTNGLMGDGTHPNKAAQAGQGRCFATQAAA